jgi:hypothetical protein
VREIYERHIQALTAAEQLQLVALLAEELAQGAAPPEEEPLHSIMELAGLGKEIWEGVDPDEYVRELRNEWNHCP